MIRERGNIKWQGMFLPEHVKMLRNFKLEVHKKQKPNLDEQQLELMQETIYAAMEENKELCFIYFSKGDFHLILGKVHYIDLHKRQLRIIDFHEELKYLLIDDLVDVREN